MTVSYRLTPRAYVLLVIAALEIAQEQPHISSGTVRRIGLALSSARRDLAKLKEKRGRTPRGRLATRPI